MGCFSLCAFVGVAAFVSVFTNKDFIIELIVGQKTNNGAKVIYTQFLNKLNSNIGCPRLLRSSQ